MAFATPENSTENSMDNNSTNGKMDTGDTTVDTNAFVTTTGTYGSEENSEDFAGSGKNEDGTAINSNRDDDDSNRADDTLKRKLDDLEHDEVSGNTSPSKKPHLDKEIRDLFPDLEKFWSTVEQDPNDFTAWTHLLQFVDQVSHKSVASEAYDAFLQKYPYCYGYWKKYADYTKRRGSSDEVQEIFNRGLRAIPLSVDLWIHFVTYIKSTYEDDPDLIRSKFKQGIATCGLEFRSDKLWEQFVQWETETNNLRNAMRVWDQMISTPTQSLKKHFEKLTEFVNGNDPSQILSTEEYALLFNEVTGNTDTDTTPESIQDDVAAKLREKVIALRASVFENTMEEVKIRSAFEEGIKRPYFHVKPVEKNQLKNWTEYLEFEIEKGDLRRIITLFERCLIACAMYAEYWDKYLKFLKSQDQKDVGHIEEVFTRVTKVHHPKMYKFSLDFAAFEETQGNLEKASMIYDELISTLDVPVLPIYYRHIHFERRRMNLDKCLELFETYLQKCQDKSLSNQVTIKYARFVNTVCGSYAKAVEILKTKLDLQNEFSPKVALALIDMGLQASPMDMDLILYAFDYGIKHFEKDVKIVFATRKLQFLEDYTDDIKTLQDAEEELSTILKSVQMEEKSESAAPSSIKAPNSDLPKLGPSVDSQPPSGYNYGDGPNPRYSSQYGQYNQGQYGGPPWNSHPQAPLPSGDPNVYGQSYVNQPTTWNSFYA